MEIDYEYPSNPGEAEGYVQLLRELRHGLEYLAQTKGRRQGQYQLTIAAPCGMKQMHTLKVKEMDQVTLMLQGIIKVCAQILSGFGFLEPHGRYPFFSIISYQQPI